MRDKIAVAGNMIVDLLYTLDKYPRQGELGVLDNEIGKSIGGAACNNTLDFAKLDAKLPIFVIGQVGDDENGEFILDVFKKHANIDTSLIKKSGITSFTSVMNERNSKQRTFFQFKGANATFMPQDIDFSMLKDVKLLHIGYILLLDEFDKFDRNYGTKMAAVLEKAQKQGIQTSIDIVSSADGQFQKIVPPALKYTDYCIINEFEAESTVDIKLRDKHGLIEENFEPALKTIKNMGVKKWIVIHAPEQVYGLDCLTGEIIKRDSLRLPTDFIKGTTGAGDAFCTGVLYGAYKDKKLDDAITWGIASASASLSAIDATTGVCPINEALSLYEKLK